MQDRFTPARVSRIADISIVVCGLPNLERTLCSIEPTHIISLVDPVLPEAVLAMPRLFGEHLVLRMEDHEDPANPHAPTRVQARQILEFTKQVQTEGTLLIHCHGGRCRSTAAALGAGLSRFAAVDDHALKSARAMLLETAPLAIPNMLLSARLDVELGLNGRLIRLAADIGRERTKALIDEACL